MPASDNGKGENIPPAAWRRGDRVVLSGDFLSFHGRVERVMMPDAIEDLINYMTINSADDCGDYWQRVFAEFAEGDKDFKQFPMYFITPDSSPGVASYEEARLIVPGLTEMQYLRLIGVREYLVRDSQLLPEIFPLET